MLGNQNYKKIMDRIENLVDIAYEYAKTKIILIIGFFEWSNWQWKKVLKMIIRKLKMVIDDNQQL